MDLQSKHLRRIKWLDKFYDKHEHRLANESYDFSYDVLWVTASVCFSFRQLSFCHRRESSASFSAGNLALGKNRAFEGRRAYSFHTTSLTSLTCPTLRVWAQLTQKNEFLTKLKKRKIEEALVEQG